MIGSLLVFYYENPLGRRKEMLISSLCYGTGALLAGSARGSSAVALIWLGLGRAIYGLGVGFAMHGVPSYIAETAPPSVRGALVSAKEAMIVVGMLLGYGLGAALQHSQGGWRLVFYAAVPVSIFYGLGIASLPPSPRWLGLRGASRAAIVSAAKVVTPLIDEDELMAAVSSNSTQNNDTISLIDALQSLVKTGAQRTALKIGLGLVTFQQITGQPSVLYYTATLFDEIGLGNGAVIGVAVWKLFATLCAVAFADSYGRKTLLYIGCSLMAFALLTLTFTTSTNLIYIVLVAMFIYIGGYQVGFGPVVWTLISEIFPMEARGKALSVAVFTNFALNALITLACSPLLAFSPSLTFAMFFILELIAIVFIKYHVPETKGLSLENITKLLEDDYINRGGGSSQQNFSAETSSLLLSKSPGSTNEDGLSFTC